MNILLFTGILTCLLVWNSYALGGAWKDAMMLGTWGHKLCLWFGLCQNVAAFSILILGGIYYAGTLLLTGAKLPLYPSDIGEFIEYFLLVSVSVVALAAQILQNLYARLDCRCIKNAGWTNYKKIHSRVSVIGALGNAFINPIKLFSESIHEADHPMKKIAVVIILSALFVSTIGFFLAFSFVRYFMNSKSARIEVHLRTLQSKRI
jgi:hypothetical protein